jgi:hypothetical protein
MLGTTCGSDGPVAATPVHRPKRHSGACPVPFWAEPLGARTPPEEPAEAPPPDEPSHIFTWERFETSRLAMVRAVPDVRHAERYGKRD